VKSEPHLLSAGTVLPVVGGVVLPSVNSSLPCRAYGTVLQVLCSDDAGDVTGCLHGSWTLLPAASQPVDAWIVLVGVERAHLLVCGKGLGNTRFTPPSPICSCARLKSIQPKPGTISYYAATEHLNLLQLQALDNNSGLRSKCELRTSLQAHNVRNRRARSSRE